MGEIHVLRLQRLPGKLESERAGVGLKGDGADQHTAQPKEACLPHRLDDGAGEMVRGGQPCRDQRPHDVTALLEVGLDLCKPVHTVGDAFVGDRADIELLSLALAGGAVACLVAVVAASLRSHRPWWRSGQASSDRCRGRAESFLPVALGQELAFGSVHTGETARFGAMVGTQAAEMMADAI